MYDIEFFNAISMYAFFFFLKCVWAFCLRVGVLRSSGEMGAEEVVGCPGIGVLGTELGPSRKAGRAYNS